MHGVDCVIMPSFTADLHGLNKAGIQHDVRKIIEFGFGGALLVADFPFYSDEEYVQFAEWAHEAAEGKLRLVYHASFNTLEQNISIAQKVTPYFDYSLLCYPANYYPTTEQQVYEYSKAFCDQTDMGVMLFPVPLWNFVRLHPAQMSMPLLRRLVDDCETVFAIKAEGDLPGIGGLLNVYNLFKDVIVSCPIESEIIPLMSVMEFQYSGTNYTAGYGDYIPKTFAAARAGNHDEAMERFWKLHPARQAMGVLGNGTQFTGLINRMSWKFADWAMGLNGGPIRQPTAKVNDGMMAQWWRGIEALGIGVPRQPNADFFIGRHPA